MAKKFEINKENNIATIKINKQLYSKQAILQTTYVLLEDYYFIVDLENDYFIITMKKKQGQITEENIYDFYNELVESQSYLFQLKNTKELRETILKRAILTQNI